MTNHLSQAEQLLEAAENAQPADRDVFLARASVHANLAVVQKLNQVDDTLDQLDGRVASIEGFMILNQPLQLPSSED